jgi:hypothetical protein
MSTPSLEIPEQEAGVKSDRDPLPKFFSLVIEAATSSIS